MKRLRRAATRLDGQVRVAFGKDEKDALSCKETTSFAREHVRLLYLPMKPRYNRVIRSTIVPSHGFGTFNVRLVIRHPFRMKSPIAGWNSNGVPVRAVPRGNLSCIMSMNVQVAKIAADVKHAKGIGVPSKYLDFPVLSLGSIATVTLKRANRVRPHRT